MPYSSWRERAWSLCPMDVRWLRTVCQATPNRRAIALVSPDVSTNSAATSRSRRVSTPSSAEPSDAFVGGEVARAARRGFCFEREPCPFAASRSCVTDSGSCRLLGWATVSPPRVRGGGWAYCRLVCRSSPVPGRSAGLPDAVARKPADYWLPRLCLSVFTQKQW